MTRTRLGSPGKTRDCPHCKTRILDSANVCPACKHHLRFGQNDAQDDVQLVPFQVEGSIRHPKSGGAWEYSVVITVSDDKGNETARHVVGVGALHPAEQRNFRLSVEVTAPAGTSNADIEPPG